jgi:hypothetical protein
LHELPAQSELLCAVAIGQEAEIPNTLEPVGKYVKQEPTDEFVSAKRHRLLTVAIAIIFPAKLNLAVVDIEEAILLEMAMRCVYRATYLRTCSGPAKGRFA